MKENNKKFYVNGASYCNGFLLDNYKNDEIHTKSWFNRLINKMRNYNFYYEIKNGKSLSEIYLETICYLENNEINAYLTVIPCNLDKKRDYYLLNKTTEKYEHVDINNYDHLYAIKDKYLISEDLINYFYFKDEEIFSINNFIKNMETLYLLINYLINKKINFYLFFDSLYFYKQNIKKIFHLINEREKHYIDILNKSIISNVKGMMDEIMLNFNIKNNQFESLIVTKDNNIFTAHPSLLAHELFYKYLLNRIDNDKNN